MYCSSDFVSFVIVVRDKGLKAPRAIKPSSLPTMTRSLVVASLLLAASPSVLSAQATASAPARPESIPAANPADVKSPDAIIAALYDVISGPAGQKRDWNRFRSLFVPGARLIPTGGRPGQPARAVMLTPDDYATRSGPSLENGGFFEIEVSRTTEQFGRILHAFSTYESRAKADDPKPFARGINSIQLLNDGTRWSIVTVYWDAERPDNPLPEKYLRK